MTSAENLLAVAVYEPKTIESGMILHSRSISQTLRISSSHECLLHIPTPINTINHIDSIEHFAIDSNHIISIIFINIDTSSISRVLQLGI